LRRFLVGLKELRKWWWELLL